jgi:hypothetical protein
MTSLRRFCTRWSRCLGRTRCTGCPRVGLSLPSEAQWEYGARAGTTWPRWVGETKEALMDGRVNIADRSYVKAGGSAAAAAELPELDDVSVAYWEVGHKPANGFGLHEVLGNVWEWCLDGYGNYPNTLQRNPVTPSLGSAFRVPPRRRFHRPRLERALREPLLRHAGEPRHRPRAPPLPGHHPLVLYHFTNHGSGTGPYGRCSA